MSTIYGDMVNFLFILCWILYSGVAGWVWVIAKKDWKFRMHHFLSSKIIYLKNYKNNNLLISYKYLFYKSKICLF